MRRLWIIPLLCAVASAQVGGKAAVGGKASAGRGIAAACTTPTGTHVTESWGDAATSCWAAGPSSCNQTWTIGAGTAQSIVASPGSPPANTACANSLQMNLPAANNYLTLAFSVLSSPFDLTGSFYVNTFPSSGNRNTMVCIGDSSGCVSGHILAMVALDNNNVGSGTTVYGTSFDTGSNSTPQAVTAGTWHTFTLHWDSTAASCSFKLDAGSANTFTCQVASNPSIMLVGPEVFGGSTFEFTIGNLAW